MSIRKFRSEPWETVPLEAQKGFYSDYRPHNFSEPGMSIVMFCGTSGISSDIISTAKKVLFENDFEHVSTGWCEFRRDRMFKTAFIPRGFPKDFTFPRVCWIAVSTEDKEFAMLLLAGEGLI